MKKIILLLSVAGFLLSACNGQDKNPLLLKKVAEPPAFEEKQQQVLKNQPVIAGNLATGNFNFRYAAKKATPGVVHIKSVVNMRQQGVPDYLKDFFGDDFWRQYFSPQGNGPQQQMGSASGVIVSDDGYIVTNNHVIDNAESIEIVLHDQRSYKATVIGTDPATDLALLKIDEKKLAFIEFGNSDSVEVGDVVLAVGNPFNLASTVTAGIVSAKARNINILTDRAAVESYIQTDAAVNRGNSGGALVDVNGKLVGINAAISTPTGVYAGYSFAIPVEIVKKTIDDLLRYGKVLRGYLGVIISDMNGDKAKTLGIGTTIGVMVDSLQPNGAAIKAGILAKDVITKINDHEVSNATELRELIARQKPGEKVKVTLIRAGKEKIIPVTLLPAQEPVSTVTASGKEVLKNLGIEIEDLSAKEKTQLKIPGGVKVTVINPGIIDRYTSMKEGFIITKINNTAINNTDDFINELKGKKGGIMLEGIYEGMGGVYYYAFGL